VLYGAREKAAGIDERGWSRIDEGGWAATANGGIVEPNGMTVELGGFWRKPTDIGERLEEVPRKLKGIQMCVEKRRGKQVFFCVRTRRLDS
jgi:hypothetical protein